MKFSILFVSVLVSCIAIAQPIKKVLNTGVSSKSAYEHMKYSISYDKFGDGFTRLEDYKIQYYSADFEKQWEKEIELVDGIGKLNWFVSSNDGENLFLGQYGSAFKVDKIDARLLKFTKSGEMQFISLSELFALRGVGGFEFFEDHFTIITISTKGAATPYTDMDFFFNLVTFDYNLKMKGEMVALPAYDEGKKHNYLWAYREYKDGVFLFESPYYLTKEGKPSNSNKKNGKERREVSITKDGEILSDETVAHPEEWSAKATDMYGLDLEFDEKRYKITLGEMQVSCLNYFDRKDGFEEVYIEKDGKKSGNLVKEFYQMVDPKLLAKKNYVPKLYFTDAMEDKINDNLVLVTQNSAKYMYYIIILDQDLTISCVMSYVGLDLAAPQRPMEKEFILMADQKKEVYGKLPSGYKDNAFTKMQEYEKSAFHTVLNYDGYQLLITDDLKAKQTVVYKFGY